MDESALERFFDNFIANDSRMIEEKEGWREELFLSLLPDELLMLYKSSQDNTDGPRQTEDNESTTASVLPDSNTNMDYSSQNSTAALPGGSPVPEQVDSSVCPMIPVMPVSHVMELPEIPHIQNVISTVRLGCHLDLNFIARKAWNVQYNPKIYKALTMRIRKPRTTAVIYRNGYVVCTGAKSEEQSRVAIRRYARILQKLGFPVSFLNFKIQNLVASCNTFPISLERLAFAHHQHCSYEPELFPGLFYSVMPGITVTIFASGRMSCSGAKTQAEIYKAFDTIYLIVNCFRRQ